MRPTAPEDGERLAAVVAALRSGVAPDEAWKTWGADVTVADDGTPSLHRHDALEASLGASARLARATGAPLADIVAGVAEVHRLATEAALRREVVAAGPRASARVLLWMPAVGLALAVVVEPGVLRLLFATMLGWLLLGMAGALTWGARRWMRALMSRAETAAEPP